MRRRWFIFGGVVLFVLGLWSLDVRVSELVPSEGGRRLAGDFFGAALTPALNYEEEAIRGVAEPFFSKAGKAAWLTVKYAVVAMSLAMILGVVGGVLGSRAWWGTQSRTLQAVRILVRLAATALRSVHELIWAILFLAAVGTSPVAAMLAMALPYGGTLAKVFSELLDEANEGAAEVMRASGGTGIAAFLGTVVEALPDLLTYTMYRLECAVRSSAVLGFVGVPTLGYEIKTAFEDGHYHEIWTLVYLLLAIVLFFEWWGGRIRAVMVQGVPSKNPDSKAASMTRLWKQRGISWFLRITGVVLAGLVSAGWLLEDKWGSGLSGEQRWQNFERFRTELIPYPVQQSGNWGEVWGWLGKLMQDKGWEALWRTFHLGTTAILLAGAVALVTLVLSSRTLASSRPRGIRMDQGRVRGLLGKGSSDVRDFGEVGSGVSPRLSPPSDIRPHDVGAYFRARDSQ